MSVFLHPCPNCRRHIRTNETTCPFCEESVRGAFAGVSPPRMPTVRLSRAALLALGTMASGTPLSGCGGEADDSNSMSTGGAASGGEMITTGGDGTQPVYGAVPTGGVQENTGGVGIGGTVPTGGVQENTGGVGIGGTVYGTFPTGGFGGDAATGGSGAVGPVYGAPEYGAPVYGLAPVPE